jgi:ubiquinol-cytochrome c reductase cytochrome c subunit
MPMRLGSLALVLAAFALALPAGAAAQSRGRALFLEGCASCHGVDARGLEDRGPSLRGAGAAAADFYLSTGRMPLAEPDDEPVRNEPAYPRRDIDALVEYLASLGGPEIPEVEPERGDLELGLRLFAENCAGCHQIVAEGGVATDVAPPKLEKATPTQIAEAVRIGPYVMPHFGEQQLDRHELDSLVRYVQLTKHPEDRGGWGIGHVGPVPEGMVAWLLAGTVLVLVARVIGRRAE